MTRPNPAAYTPTTEETTRLRNGGRDAAPMAGDDDYEIGRLSPERCVPNPRRPPITPTNYAIRWRKSAEAERQIDRLIDEAAERKQQPPRAQSRSGGIFLPPLPDNGTDLELF